jgi:hypothetical protein
MLAGIGAFQRVIGYVLTAGVVACLILAWMMTAPLLRCGVYLSDLYRRRIQSEP